MFIAMIDSNFHTMPLFQWRKASSTFFLLRGHHGSWITMGMNGVKVKESRFNRRSTTEKKFTTTKLPVLYRSSRAVKAPSPSAAFRLLHLFNYNRS
mmetsp:Transcript_6541/g.10191  ORF Transcript_6541/g.10191 Transcript_6541/m.10191 type:complete len:96 (+) Transcript_6541:451-738(+)